MIDTVTRCGYASPAVQAQITHRRGDMAEAMPNPDQASALGHELAQLVGCPVYERSISPVAGGYVFLARAPEGRRLGLLSLDADTLGLELATRQVSWRGAEAVLGQGVLSHANLVRLRALLPWMAPVPVGPRKSAGFGDRLGLATPGHVRAMRRSPGVFPVFAQQSIREMERTGRTPEQVLDDATWGVLQEGWRAGYGADADHLKTTEDIDLCLSAGFVMFTFDPRDHVNDGAESASVDALRSAYEALPWARLRADPQSTYDRYVGQSWELGGRHLLVMTEMDLLRAACKYGRALAHLSELYQHLAAVVGSRPWEVEISVDETETPTRPAEHWFIARELRRLGVQWVSLAPRYVGRFEKGVDYIGDLHAFEQDWAWHVAIAQALGPYKLSVHSGSDKFSVYPLAARHAGELVHVKTAGTSYLEALRVIAEVDPAFFREILGFSRNRYDDDRATYHVSARKENVPLPADVPDADLPGLLDQFDARQVLHVAYGSVLDRFGRRLHTVLEQHEARYSAVLERHFARHLAPFRRA